MRRSVAAVGVLVALVTVACASQSDRSGPTGPRSTAPPDPSASVEPSGTPAAAPALEDGRHFGYIRSADPGAMTLRFDPARFLTGEEANAAAAEHGDAVPVPNDYYIVNDERRPRTLPIDPGAEILVIDWNRCCELVPGELGPFLDAFTIRRPPWDAMYQGRRAPYWITVRGGAVVRIEVQYLP